MRIDLNFNIDNIQQDFNVRVIAETRAEKAILDMISNVPVKITPERNYHPDYKLMENK